MRRGRSKVQKQPIRGDALEQVTETDRDILLSTFLVFSPCLLVEEVLVLEKEVQERLEVDKEEVQEKEEEKEETGETVISQQSPPTPQKQDTKVTSTCLT